MKSHALSSVGTAVFLALPAQPDLGSLASILPAATNSVHNHFQALVVVGDGDMMSFTEALAGMELIGVDSDTEIFHATEVGQIDFDELASRARDILFIGSALDMEVSMRVGFSHPRIPGGEESFKFNSGHNAKVVAYERTMDHNLPFGVVPSSDGSSREEQTSLAA